MISIETDETEEDIAHAINTVVKACNRSIDESNQFAKSMMGVDPDLAITTLRDTREIIHASKLLLYLVINMLSDDDEDEG